MAICPTCDMPENTIKCQLSFIGKDRTGGGGFVEALNHVFTLPVVDRARPVSHEQH